MEALQTTLNKRYEQAQNGVLLGNLALVTNIINNHPFQWQPDYQQLAFVGQQYSALSDNSRQVVVDRPFESLIEQFGLASEQLCTFAAGGTVLDIGCGRSNFLDAFKPRAATVAVDLNDSHLAYQRRRGHSVHQIAAEQLQGVATGSVRLLHASYSAPFWTTSPKEAVATAHEYRRVLEIGGVALVGPLGNKIEHNHAETVVESCLDDLPAIPPWGRSTSDIYSAQIRSAFMGALAFNGGLLRIIGQRYHPVNGKLHSHQNKQRTHVPNFLIMQRTAVTESDGSLAPGRA